MELLILGILIGIFITVLYIKWFLINQLKLGNIRIIKGNKFINSLFEWF